MPVSARNNHRLLVSICKEAQVAGINIRVKPCRDEFRLRDAIQGVLFDLKLDSKLRGYGKLVL